MQTIILAIGSQGDVRPYLALAAGLRRAGHDTCIATHATFNALAEQYGVPLIAVSGNPREIVGRDAREWLDHDSNPLQARRGFMRVARPLIRQLATDCARACQDADVIIVNGLAFLPGYYIGGRLRRPVIRAFYAPTTPTRAYPAGLTPGWLNLGSGFNLLSHVLERELMWLFFKPLMGDLRDALGMSPPGARPPFGELDRQRRLLLYGFSDAVVPRPADWGDWIRVTGYWFLEPDRDWRPPTALVDFLAGGPPPVYIGFGSMSSENPEQMLQTVTQALRAAGRRGVLSTGWGGVTGTAATRDVFVVDSIPHDWLFQHVSAVVHHGGAGTTASALRAGAPNVIVPFISDQPFWGRRVRELGAGPDPIPVKRLTVKSLAEAIQTATTDARIQERAARIGERIRSEDGVVRAVETLEREVLRSA